VLALFAETAPTAIANITAEPARGMEVSKLGCGERQSMQPILACPSTAGAGDVVPNGHHTGDDDDRQPIAHDNNCRGEQFRIVMPERSSDTAIGSAEVGAEINPREPVS
jgi:hypothetical protein